MNGIEKDLEGTARVVRLDIGSDLGKSAAGRFGVTSVPTTLVLDAAGELAHRETGLPSRKEIVASVTSVLRNGSQGA